MDTYSYFSNKIWIITIGMSESILIADDHSIVRVGLTILLRKLRPGARIEQTSNFEGVLQLTASVPFDLIIIDINMPGGSYQETVDIVKRRQPKVKILIFSALDERAYAVRYLRNGSDGFLHKLAREEEVRRAVEEMLKIGKYVSDEVRNALVLESLNKDKQYNNPLDVLSDREMDIARLLVQGLRLKEIAGQLNLHITTVSTYKIRVFEKLKISSIVELMDRFRFYEIP